MKTRPFRHVFFPACLLFVLGTFQLHGSVSGAAEQAGNQPTESSMTLKLVGEDRDVGLKRMEILEKTLSPELLAKKRAYVLSRTILVDEDGLAKWAAGRGSREAAAEEMKVLIHGAFRIPAEQITIVVAPN